MELRVDRERCIGAGMCVPTEPDAVRLCPSGAITTVNQA